MKKRGFTLIELLAVIVILAIIALIATPIVMNVIKNTKKGAAERSAENYLRAVETAIAEERLDGSINDGTYVITDDGSLQLKTDAEVIIVVNVSGDKPNAGGTIKITDGKVIEISNLEVNNIYVIVVNNQAQAVETSALIAGTDFNKVIKNLVNSKTTMTHKSSDSKIKSIEFYSNGDLPEGYTKESLESLTNVSVSDDNKINAYNNNGNIYVYSDNQILFNENSSYMFGYLKGLTKLKLDGANTSKVKNMSYMFFSYGSTAPLDLSKLDTTNVTNMIYMFGGYASPVALDLSGLDTSNIKSMLYMFSSYRSTAPLDLSKLDTSSVTTMYGIFYNYNSTTPLDLSGLDTSNVSSMGRMFEKYNSSSLLNLSELNTNKVKDMSYMFSSFSNSAITSLDLTKFDTSNVTNMMYMFKDSTNIKQIKGTEGKWVYKTDVIITDMFIGCGTDRVTIVPAA